MHAWQGPKSGLRMLAEKPLHGCPCYRIETVAISCLNCGLHLWRPEAHKMLAASFDRCFLAKNF